MLYLYTGTDRVKARSALNAAVDKSAKKTARIVRLSDVSASADISAALSAGGLFTETRVVVFDGVLMNDEFRERLLGAIAEMARANDAYFILEEKPDADTRKKIEKHAEKSERFDLPGKGRDGSIFDLANALRKGEKRRLWLGLQREYAKGAAPEAVHGTLFWGVKDMYLKAGSAIEKTRAKNLVALLAELPHEARRNAEDLEYALERFVLSGA